MKSFKHLTDDTFINVTDIATLWGFSVEEVLGMLRGLNVIHVQIFDTYHPNSSGPLLSGTPCRFVRYPLDGVSIQKIITHGEVSGNHIHERHNPSQTYPKTNGEPHIFTIKDLSVLKKDVLYVAQKLDIPIEQKIDLPLELSIALDCYKDLYKNGLPSPPNRRNETTEIHRWLKNNYTNLDEEHNINMVERITFAVNPAPNLSIKDIPRRK